METRESDDRFGVCALCHTRRVWSDLALVKTPHDRGVLLCKSELSEDCMTAWLTMRQGVSGGMQHG